MSEPQSPETAGENIDAQASLKSINENIAALGLKLAEILKTPEGQLGKLRELKRIEDTFHQEMKAYLKPALEGKHLGPKTKLKLQEAMTQLESKIFEIQSKISELEQKALDASEIQ